MEHEAMQFKWERPHTVYSELFGAAKISEREKLASAAQGITASVAVAFCIVIGSAFVFRSLEAPLKSAWTARNSFHYNAQNALQNEASSLKPLRTHIFNYIADLGSAVWGVDAAHAASLRDYSASVDAHPPDIYLAPREEERLRLKFTNEGTYNWRHKGRSFISLYVRHPKKTGSPLHDASWLSARHVATLKDSLVGPGRSGYVELNVRAPQKIGRYSEVFALAAENTAWIKGSDVQITVHVVKEKPAASQAADDAPEPPLPTMLWDDTASTLSASATGTSGSVSVQAPAASGTVAVTAQEATSTVPAQDQPHATSTPQQEAFSTPVASSTVETHQLSEPAIRVGLYRTDTGVQVASDFDYALYDTDHTLLGQIPAGQSVTLSFDAQRTIYRAASDAGSIESAKPLRLEPRVAEGSVFRITDHFIGKGRVKTVNYNQFHGTLELRFAHSYLWVINELPLETYLKGLAESSPGMPEEFDKALAIAARSYAFAHMGASSDHTASGFDVDAEYDQIYKGVVREQYDAEWIAAVSATRGIVATYHDAPVTTPYFTQSNGRTKSWHEVWGGPDKPWLVPVKTPYDRGRRRLGHGVGMSVHDAIARAKKKHADVETILQYYYRGTETQQLWR